MERYYRLPLNDLSNLNKDFFEIWFKTEFQEIEFDDNGVPNFKIKCDSPFFRLFSTTLFKFEGFWFKKSF